MHWLVFFPNLIDLFKHLEVDKQVWIEKKQVDEHLEEFFEHAGIDIQVLL